VLVVAGSLPAGAALAASGVAASGQQTANDSSVNVTVGQQLSTVLSVTSDDVQTEVEETAFELSYEREDEASRAEAVASRAEELRERAETIREDYEEATEARREGELTRSEYAQRLATLNARAENVLRSYERFQRRAANVSALELRAAGLNRSALAAAIENLDTVQGAGASALLLRFTGQREGEVELETDGGLSIAVEREDGERSREFERLGDDSTNVTVSQATALETARTALAAPANGSWTLTGSRIDRSDGVYAFSFRLRSNASTGEAEVEVDGSSGNVTSLEEEIEARDADEEEDDEGAGDDEDDRDEAEFAVVLAEGTPEANETVTVQVLTNGEPASNASVFVNGQRAGTTGSNGTLSLTLPDSGDVEIVAERGEREGELSVDLGDEDEVFRKLNTSASLSDGTVTVSVTYDGDAVRNATVEANGDTVGTTGADGTVAFEIANDTEELALEITKGEFEAELGYTVENGSLTLREAAHEGDDEREAEEDDDSEGTETPDSEDEETETSDDDSEETETPEDDESG
jgi:hypothetical protein